MTCTTEEHPPTMCCKVMDEGKAEMTSLEAETKLSSSDDQPPTTVFDIEDESIYEAEITSSSSGAKTGFLVSKFEDKQLPTVVDVEVKNDGNCKVSTEIESFEAEPEPSLVEHEPLTTGNVAHQHKDDNIDEVEIQYLEAKKELSFIEDARSMTVECEVQDETNNEVEITHSESEMNPPLVGDVQSTAEVKDDLESDSKAKASTTGPSAVVQVDGEREVTVEISSSEAGTHFIAEDEQLNIRGEYKEFEDLVDVAGEVKEYFQGLGRNMVTASPTSDDHEHLQDSYETEIKNTGCPKGEAKIITNRSEEENARHIGEEIIEGQAQRFSTAAVEDVDQQIPTPPTRDARSAPPPSAQENKLQMLQHMMDNVHISTAPYRTLLKFQDLLEDYLGRTWSVKAST
ncbi:hypothetical protein HK102_002303 [Quaeritorhiza haematococci]|nr:hypothetical protein HK102_002303 [Quaeritorhiza haematococci]